MGCCELYVFPGRPIMFIPNSRIHLEWPDTYKLLPDALHPALLIFLPFYPFTFVSQPFQQTNRYAVVGAMPLERIWVVASYMFSLAGLSYLSRTHAPFRIARHLQVAARCFTPSFSHLFTFSPLHFCFPALPTDQPLCGGGRNST